MLLAAALLTATTISLSSCSTKDNSENDGDKKEAVDKKADKKADAKNDVKIETKAPGDEINREEVSPEEIDAALVLVFDAATNQINNATTVDELNAIYAELDDIVDELGNEFPDYNPSDDVVAAMAKCATAYETRKAQL